MAFRERRFQPVPPGQRPTRRRSAARVLVRAEGTVLLFCDTDPGLPASRWWVTPGGGIDVGETPREAAVRELFEETGLRIIEDQLVGPIAERTVTHGYSDQILVQHETFFSVDVDRFAIDVSGHTPEEQITLSDHGWFTMDEVASMWVWPDELAALFAGDGSTSVDLGEMEESTVAVAQGG